MAEKEESQFLQELENRLDSLFGEDKKTAKEQAAASEALQGLEMEQASDDAIARETTLESETTIQQEQAIKTEVDLRFAEIFGDGKQAPPAAESPQAMAPAVSTAPVILGASFDNLKSTVLSLEWEISLNILEQMEKDIDEFSQSLPDNHISLGLLSILRFVGKYLRVWQEESNSESIHLLLSVFDQLENVLFSTWMTDSEKRQCLMEGIQHYRYWVERVDLEYPAEKQNQEAAAESLHLEMESPELRTTSAETAPALKLEPEPEPEPEPAPAPDMPDIESSETIALPAQESIIPEIAKPAPSLETAAEPIIDEAEENMQTQQIAEDVMPPEQSAKTAPQTENVVNTLSCNQSNLEEIKRYFQSEIDALKDEINRLKNERLS